MVLEMNPTQWVSISEIKTIANMSKPTIIKALRALETLNLVNKDMLNHYRLTGKESLPVKNLYHPLLKHINTSKEVFIEKKDNAPLGGHLSMREYTEAVERKARYECHSPTPSTP